MMELKVRCWLLSRHRFAMREQQGRLESGTLSMIALMSFWGSEFIVNWCYRRGWNPASSSKEEDVGGRTISSRFVEECRPYLAAVSVAKPVLCHVRPFRLFAHPSNQI